MGGNASYSPFGWDFQCNTAIVLMIKYIKEAESIRVEGKTEDIILSLKGAKKIFCQAKSKTNPNDATDARQKIKESLLSLIDSNMLGQLLYATNKVSR